MCIHTHIFLSFFFQHNFYLYFIERNINLFLFIFKNRVFHAHTISPICKKVFCVHNMVSIVKPSNSDIYDHINYRTPYGHVIIKRVIKYVRETFVQCLSSDINFPCIKWISSVFHMQDMTNIFMVRTPRRVSFHWDERTSYNNIIRKYNQCERVQCEPPYRIKKKQPTQRAPSSDISLLIYLEFIYKMRGMN